MESSYPVESLHRRLATGLGNKGGARGSLTRCAVRLSGLKRTLEEVAGSSSTTTSENSKEESAAAVAATSTTKTRPSSSLVAEASESLIRELQLSRIELTKLFLMAQRQEEELNELKQQNEHNNIHATTTNTNVDSSSENKEPKSGNVDSKMLSAASTNTTLAMERQAIHQLRKELQQASSTVAAKAEYEQTAKLLRAQHPISTAVLTQEIQTLQAALDKAKTEYSVAKAQMKLRQSQFRLLLQCLLDLKQSLNEPLLEEATTLAAATQKQQQQSQDSGEGDDGDNDKKDSGKNSREDHHCKSVGDANEKEDTTIAKHTGIGMMEEDDEEDEEGALYDDL